MPPMLSAMPPTALCRATARIRLLLEMFLPQRKRSRREAPALPSADSANPISTAALIVLVLLIPNLGQASSDSAKQLYEAGRYKDALAEYQRLLESQKNTLANVDKTQMELVITDMQGRIVRRQSVNLIAGFNTIPMNVKNLAAGTYQLFGYAADEKTRVLRFVIQ